MDFHLSSVEVLPCRHIVCTYGDKRTLGDHLPALDDMWRCFIINSHAHASNELTCVCVLSCEMQSRVYSEYLQLQDGEQGQHFIKIQQIARWSQCGGGNLSQVKVF